MSKRNKFAVAFTATALTAALLPSAHVSAELPSVFKASADQIILKVKAGKDGNMVAAKHGAKVKKDVPRSGYKLVSVPAGRSADELLAQFQKDADVELAELDQLVTINATPNDPNYATQWHLPKIQADLAWNHYTGSSAVKVAIVDTGVDIQQPDLAAKILPGYDFINNDSNADDDNGSGTHLAGSAAAIGNNSVLGSGVDWNARILPVKVFNASGAGSISIIETGIRYAADQGAKVILLAFFNGTYSASLQNAINYAWGKGAVIIAPAGNSNITTVQYPANYTNVLSIGCSTTTDTKCSFSNYGTWVDIAAPGQNILATANGGGMVNMSGTSRSAAVAAGVASLVWNRFGTAASPSTIVSKITSTADAVSGTGTYWSNGRINAYRAVTQ